jgi:sugar lactone lactonase YvrE
VAEVSEPSLEIAVPGGAELGEGAVWDHERQQLIWVDISARRIHFYDPFSGRDESVEVAGTPSVAIPRRKGGLIVALAHGIAFLTTDGEIQEVASLPQGEVLARMNDGNCDSTGRFWVGTMGLGEEAGAGSLYRLEPDLTVTRVLADVTISNGIDWSPDDRLMYYVDSAEGRVDVFDFDVASGAVRGRRPFVSIEDDGVVPDGLTVDAEGALWVACWGGSAVKRYTSDGLLDGELRLPTQNITSCAFGGPEFGDLYITSARETLSVDELASEPDAGAVFVCRPRVQGRPQRPFEG